MLAIIMECSAVGPAKVFRIGWPRHDLLPKASVGLTSVVLDTWDGRLSVRDLPSGSGR